MATWVIGAAAASIAVTALLAWVLFRLNASAQRRAQQAGGGGGAGVLPADGDGCADDPDRCGRNGGGD